MTSIASRGLTLSYQRQVIIDALDMQLPQGKISVLIGSNGCGKSTLLKSFARLLKPQQGSVILNGVDIQQSPPPPWLGSWRFCRKRRAPRRGLPFGNWSLWGVIRIRAGCNSGRRKTKPWSIAR